MKRKIPTIRDVPSAKRRVNRSIESGFNLNTSNSRQSCNEYGYLLIASISNLPCEIYLHIEHYVSGVPLSDEELRKAVKLFFDNKEECECIYGKMKYWNTRKVTNMSNLFKDRKNFNEDISMWNTSNVTNMNCMFGKAITFNQDIGQWDVSNVTDMRYMFDGAKAFNQDIRQWDASNVTYMMDMFTGASAYSYGELD